MTGKEELIALRESTGMNKKQFAEYFEIPYRTFQDWELGNRKMPEYLFKLMQYKVEKDLYGGEKSMNLHKIYFSPTGGTKKVADILAECWDCGAKELDLCSYGMDYSAYSLNREDICIVAVPSFGGRVAATATERLRQLNGNGARAIAVAVYGNRAYEDTLVELKAVLEERGFQVAAGVAAIAEHSIVRQFAAGRPDEADKEELKAFAVKIQKKLAENAEEGTEAYQAVKDLEAVTGLVVPGSVPYKEYKVIPMIPQPGETCAGCGVCAEVCPVQAIQAENFQADTEICIGCMRCVSACAKGSRTVAKEKLEGVTERLKAVCSSRKENELYL